MCKTDDALDLIWAAWSKMLHDIAISRRRQCMLLDDVCNLERERMRKYVV